MITCDAPVLLREWFAANRQLFQDNEIGANLRLPTNGENLNKAIVTLETKTHVASITVWGTGMFEFIVLDIAAQNEVIVRDRELDSLDGINNELTQSLSEFLRGKRSGE